MKKYLFASLLTFLFVAPLHAANVNLDQLLEGIKTDIAAKRLSTPAGNNALDKIQTYRKQAPYDFRVVALTYEWGEAYVSLAKNAIAQNDYAKAQGYLDIVWPIAALTPGLEGLQADIDKNYKGTAAAAAPQAPSAADLKRQQQVAAQAAAEKARVAAEQKRQQEEQKRQQELAKKKAAEEQAKRQQQERERRLAAEKAAAAAKAKGTAAAALAATAPAAAIVASAPAALSTQKVTRMWEQAEEESAPIATYPLDNDHLTNRDREAMAKSLVPVCKAIVDNDASVVVHAEDKAAYRWLTVRLTLCLRHEDKSFRLRHSYQSADAGSEPYIALHPARDVSLIKQVHES